jgi:hypothetical protein
MMHLTKSINGFKDYLLFSMLNTCSQYYDGFGFFFFLYIYIFMMMRNKDIQLINDVNGYVCKKKDKKT